jgi:manganese/iron transport system substrate-binding protein
MVNPKLVERVAQEASVKIGPELYTDALGAPGSEGGTYIDALRFNARALVDLLK